MTRSVVTKRGDKGTTDLFGICGIPKDHPRFHAQGDIDELNAILGLLLSYPLPSIVRPTIEHIQHMLFRVGADLATPTSVTHINIKRMRREDIEHVEQTITTLESTLQPQRSFILPNGSRVASLLHQARAVCRRAERWTVSVSRKETVNQEILIYLNRLSDYLFIAARIVNMHMNLPEEIVDYS